MSEAFAVVQRFCVLPARLPAVRGASQQTVVAELKINSCADLHGAPDLVRAPKEVTWDKVTVSVRRMGLPAILVSSPILAFVV